MPSFELAVQNGFNTGGSFAPTVGLVAQAGSDYMFNRNWGVFLEEALHLDNGEVDRIRSRSADRYDSRGRHDQDYFSTVAVLNGRHLSLLSLSSADQPCTLRSATAPTLNARIRSSDLRVAPAWKRRIMATRTSKVYRGSLPPVPRRRPRYTDRTDGPRNVGLFAGHHISFAPQEGDGWDFAEELTSHEPGGSGAGEDAGPDDGKDQAREGAARKRTGRLAARSSRYVDRLRSESREIGFDGENDVLRRLRDVSDPRREPERYYLGVLVFPKEADGRLRLFVDHKVPTTSGPRATPAVQRGVKPPKPSRPRTRNKSRPYNLVSGIRSLVRRPPTFSSWRSMDAIAPQRLIG